MEKFFKDIIETIVNVSKNFEIGLIFLVLCAALAVVFLINIIFTLISQQSDTYYKLKKLNNLCLEQLEKNTNKKAFFENFHKQAKKGGSRATEVYKTFLETRECKIQNIFDATQIISDYAKPRNIILPVGVLEAVLMFVWAIAISTESSIALAIAKSLILPIVVLAVAFIFYFILAGVINSAPENIQTAREFLKQNLAKLFKNQDEFFEAVKNFEEAEMVRRNKTPQTVEKPVITTITPEKEKTTCDAVLLTPPAEETEGSETCENKQEVKTEKEAELKQMFVLSGSIEEVQAQLKQQAEQDDEEINVDVFCPVKISEREDEVEKVLENYINAVGFKIDVPVEKSKEIEVKTEKEIPAEKFNRLVDVNLLEASLKYENEREGIEVELETINTSLEAEREEFLEIIAKEQKALETIKRNKFLAKDDTSLKAYTNKETDQENKIAALNKLMRDSEANFRRKEKDLRAKLAEKEQIMNLKRKLAETQQASKTLEADTSLTTTEKAQRKQSINDALISLLDAMEKYENK